MSSSLSNSHSVFASTGFRPTQQEATPPVAATSTRSALPASSAIEWVIMQGVACVDANTDGKCTANETTVRDVVVRNESDVLAHTDASGHFSVRVPAQTVLGFDLPSGYSSPTGDLSTQVFESGRIDVPLARAVAATVTSVAPAATQTPNPPLTTAKPTATTVATALAPAPTKTQTPASTATIVPPTQTRTPQPSSTATTQPASATAIPPTQTPEPTATAMATTASATATRPVSDVVAIAIAIAIQPTDMPTVVATVTDSPTPSPTAIPVVAVAIPPTRIVKPTGKPTSAAPVFANQVARNAQPARISFLSAIPIKYLLSVAAALALVALMLMLGLFAHRANGLKKMALAGGGDFGDARTAVIIQEKSTRPALLPLGNDWSSIAQRLINQTRLKAVTVDAAAGILAAGAQPAPIFVLGGRGGYRLIFTIDSSLPVRGGFVTDRSVVAGIVELSGASRADAHNLWKQVATARKLGNARPPTWANWYLVVCR